MNEGFPIIMLAFSGMLLIYAGLMALTKDYKMLPLRMRQSVEPKDCRKYMTQLAKVIAIVAAVPGLSGLLGFWNIPVAVVILIGGIILAIWMGTRIMKDANL